MNWHKKPPQFITDNPDYDPFITDNPDYDPSAAALEPKLEYNTPGGRVAAPNLQGDVLRSALGSIYVKYIMNRQGFDFASVPWEFLERALTPHELMNRYEVYNPKFDLPDWLSKRNCLSRILQNARHKKAHGHATPPSTDQEQHEWDIASWLLYSCLLDFIAGETSPATDAREVQSIKDRLHARLLPGYTNRHPNYLTARDDVAWLPFVTYTMLWAILASKEARYNWTSKETRNAAKIVGEYAMTSISLKPVTT